MYLTVCRHCCNFSIKYKELKLRTVKIELEFKFEVIID